MAQRGKLFLVVVAVSLAGTAMLLAGSGGRGRRRTPLQQRHRQDRRRALRRPPNNQPHVGCTFQVDFYGYDEGDLDATVTFEAHPPTGPVQVLLTDTVFIGEDDNSGGGGATLLARSHRGGA